MEEVDDILEEVPDMEPELDPVAEEPEPKKKKLTEKVVREGCGKSVSAHCYKYSHRCKPRAPDEAPPPPILKRETSRKPEKPVKHRAVINRTPEFEPEPFQPTQADIYNHLLQQRQQQAFLRHQAIVAPYAEMLRAARR